MQDRKKLLRQGAVVAIVVCGYMAVCDLLLQRIYARGTAQGLLSALNSLSTMLSIPGYLACGILGLREGHHVGRFSWCVIFVLNLILYTIGVAMLLWISAWRRSRKLREKPAADTSTAIAPQQSSSISRRRLIAAGAGAVGALAVGYPMLVATRRFEITRNALPIRDLPLTLEGLRIVQLTDVHHGPWIPLEHVHEIVQTINGLHPDLIFLTGDYVYQSSTYIAPVIAALSQLRAKIGVVGVLGNHDWWENGPMTKREFARVGIPLIDNTRMFLSPDRQLVQKLKKGLCIAGVGDFYEDEQLYKKALGSMARSIPRILLSHNPDVAEEPEIRDRRFRVDAMLCGHTHGGQVYVPLLGTPVVPSRYGQKYSSGWVQGPACPVYICRGTGHSMLPIRIGVPPEIAMFELQRAAEDAAAAVG